MNRRTFMTAAAAAAFAPACSADRRSRSQAINYDALAALRTEGLDDKTSQVMKTASYMMDVLGPRLSGSPGIRKSGEWVVSKMKEWGLTGATLEPWPADPTGTNNGFPRGWSELEILSACGRAQRLPDHRHVDRLDAGHQRARARRVRAGDRDRRERR